MATNFPNSPSNGDTHTFGGATYTYNSTRGAWLGPSSGGGGGASVTVSETAPTSPSEGDLWFDPSVLKTFVYYNDGTANQWVQNNPTGGGGSGGGASVTVSETAPSSPSAGDLWWSSSEAAMYIYYTDADSSQWVQATTPGADGAAGAAGSAAVYATIDLLPASANTGDQAFVTGSNRLYLWNGTGWYNIALINTNPTISGVSASYGLATDGTATTVTITASDPEGIPITYSLASDTSGSVATVTQGTGASTNVFTITPSTSDANAGTFTLTFRASDGVNLASAPAEFSLEFSVVNSHYTSALITSVGANNAVNNTFIDSSSSSHTITTNGTAAQSTFSPYRHGGYSTSFDGSGDYVSMASDTSFGLGTGDFTIEWWAYQTATASYAQVFAVGNGAGGIGAHMRNNGDITVTRPGTAVDHTFAANLSSSGNTWYHVALVRNGSTLTCFVNGTSVGTGTNSTNYAASHLNIGIDGNNSSSPFTGIISDFRIVKGTAVYTADFTPPTERLTAITNTSLLTCHLPYIADGSTNSHSITVNGNTSTKPFGPYDYSQYSSASNGGSLQFDGNSDAIEIADNDAFDFGTGDLTIECWVYPKETGNNYPGFLGSVSGWGSQAASGFRFDNLGDSKFQMSWYGPGDPFIESQSTFKHNQWYHFVVTRTGGNTWRMFVNGILEDVGTNSTAYDICVGGTSFQVGGKTWDGGNGWFNGNVADVLLTKGSVVTEYQTSSTTVGDKIFTPRTTPISSSGSELHLKGTNPGIIDKSQSAQAITLSGDVKSSTTAYKYLTSSMYFDGSGDYVTAPSNAIFDFGTGDYTIESWINIPDVTSTWQAFISRGYTATGGWRLYKISGNSDLRFYYTGTSYISATSTGLVDNTWHHIAVVRSSGTITIYVDGVSKGSGSDGSTSNNPGSYAIEIGSGVHSSTFPITGYMSDVRITKGLARYTSAFTPPTAALKG